MVGAGKKCVVHSQWKEMVTSGNWTSMWLDPIFFGGFWQQLRVQSLKSNLMTWEKFEKQSDDLGKV